MASQAAEVDANDGVSASMTVPTMKTSDSHGYGDMAAAAAGCTPIGRSAGGLGPASVETAGSGGLGLAMKVGLLA